MSPTPDSTPPLRSSARGYSTNMLTPMEESGKQGREEEPERWIYLQNMSNGDTGHISKGKDLLLGSFILHFRWQFLSRGGWRYHKTKDPFTLFPFEQSQKLLLCSHLLSSRQRTAGFVYRTASPCSLLWVPTCFLVNTLLQQIFTKDLRHAAQCLGPAHTVISSTKQSQPHGT